MNTRHFSQLPKPYLAYPKIIQALLLKKKAQQRVLPQVEYVVDSFQVDLKHLQSYRQICGFQDNQTIPAIYLAVLSQSLQMSMMGNEDFPFAVLGLVHIRNKIQQHRLIKVDEKLTLSCRFGEIRPHEKGLQFDFITTVKVADDIVMQGLTTYLSRQKTSLTVIEKTKPEQHTDFVVQDTWQITENTGRRYALVSGDFNLIHLHALTAKAFGFKQAIAHGMWSKAKALAHLTLPAQYVADVWFKLPIYLPSNVDFLIDTKSENTEFLIRHAKNHKPHLRGTVSLQN